MVSAKPSALALALACALSACSLVEDVNSNDYSLAQTGAVCASVGSGAGAVTSGNAACDSCLSAQCCSAAGTCATPGADGGASDCVLLYACYAACGVGDAGTTCRAGCLADNLGGLEGVVELGSCSEMSCAGMCAAF
jgi:hypothetical protein